MTDLSRLSDDELFTMIHQKTSQAQNNGNEPSAQSGLFHSLKEYQKGALKGGAQAIGDIGASAANFGISGIEKLIGEKIPHVPHPVLLEQQPSSMEENLGRHVGEFASLFVPGLGGAGLTAKIVRSAPRIAASAGLGSLLGAASNEDHRGVGALLGGFGGAAAGALPKIAEKVSSFRSKNITQNIVEKMKEAQERVSPKYEEALKFGEDIRMQRPKINIHKITDYAGDEAHTLREFYRNPTITNAHHAQSDLFKFIRRMEKAQVINPLTRGQNASLQEARKARDELKGLMSTELEKFDKGKGKLFEEATEQYAKEVGPYLIKEIKKYQSKNPNNKIDEKELVTKLMKNSSFMKFAKEKHPELIQRHNLEKILKSHLVSHIAGPAAGVGLGVYEFLRHLK